MIPQRDEKRLYHSQMPPQSNAKRKEPLYKRTRHKILNFVIFIITMATFIVLYRVFLGDLPENDKSLSTGIDNFGSLDESPDTDSSFVTEHLSRLMTGEGQNNQNVPPSSQHINTRHSTRNYDHVVHRTGQFYSGRISPHNSHHLSRINSIYNYVDIPGTSDSIEYTDNQPTMLRVPRPTDNALHEELSRAGISSSIDFKLEHSVLDCSHDYSEDSRGENPTWREVFPVFSREYHESLRIKQNLWFLFHKESFCEYGPHGSINHKNFLEKIVEDHRNFHITPQESSSVEWSNFKQKKFNQDTNSATTVSESKRNEIRRYFEQLLDEVEVHSNEIEQRQRVHEFLKNLPLPTTVRKIVESGNIPLKVHCRYKRIPVTNRTKNMDHRLNLRCQKDSNKHARKQHGTEESPKRRFASTLIHLGDQFKYKESNVLCDRIRNTSTKIRPYTGSRGHMYASIAVKTKIKDIMYDQVVENAHFVDFSTVECTYDEVKNIKMECLCDDDRELISNIFFSVDEDFVEYLFGIFEENGVIFPQELIDAITYCKMLVPILIDPIPETCVNSSTMRQLFVKYQYPFNPFNRTPLSNDILQCIPHQRLFDLSNKFLFGFGEYYTKFMRNLIEASLGIYINEYS